MSDTRVGLSAPAVAFANETLTYCIEHLLLRWFRLPLTLPEVEAVELRKDIQRVLGHLLVELESSKPAMQQRVLLEMRGLAEAIAQFVAPFETDALAVDVPVLKLVYSESDTTLPLVHAGRGQ